MLIHNRFHCAIRVSRHRRAAATLLLVMVWIAVVATGMWLLWQYEHAAGLIHQTPNQWPAECRISPVSNKPTLLFFAHPKCPCTRASLGELEQIMTRCRDQVDAYALFVKPAEIAIAGWEKTDLWRSAESIPGVTVLCDTNGTEAERFQAATSGFVALYDRQGQLRFRGGITASRGHRGENLGRSSIVALLREGSAVALQNKVYGCELGTNLEQPSQSCCQD